MTKKITKYTALFFIIPVLLLSFPGCKGKGKEISLKGKKLRSEFKQITKEEMQTLIKQMGFFESRINSSSGGIVNEFELITVKKTISDKTVEEKAVIDHASNLVWLQSGPIDKMNYYDTQTWIKELNKVGYCGYNNWRLPTLEEALTLMENHRVDRRYIDPIFSTLQDSIRTGDIVTPYYSWSVSFHHGRVFRVSTLEQDSCRLVTEYTQTK